MSDLGNARLVLDHKLFSSRDKTLFVVKLRSDYLIGLFPFKPSLVRFGKYVIMIEPLSKKIVELENDGID